MSEKRFKSTLDEDTMSIMPYLVSDNEEEAFYNLQGCVELLNEQQSTIERLEKENKELEKNFDDIVNWASEIAKRNVLLDEKIGRLQQEEKLYAQEILRLNTLLKQYQANQDLGGGY